MLLWNAIWNFFFGKPAPVAPPAPEPEPVAVAEAAPPPPKWSPAEVQARINAQEAANVGGIPIIGQPGRCGVATAHGVDAHVMSPEELARYIGSGPLLVGSDRNIEPPADLSFARRAVWLAVVLAMPDEQRSHLYARGGMPLVRETIAELVERFMDE